LLRQSWNMCIYVWHSAGSYYAVAISLVKLLPLNTAPMEIFVTQSYKLWCFIWCWNWFPSSRRYAAATSTASEIRLPCDGPISLPSKLTLASRESLKLFWIHSERYLLSPMENPRNATKLPANRKRRTFRITSEKAADVESKAYIRILYGSKLISKSVALRSIASLGTQQYLIVPLLYISRKI